MCLSSIVQLRPATLQDADFLYRLHKAAMQHYVAQTWKWEEAWQQQHFRQHFDPSTCQIIVSQGQAVGVLAVVRDASAVYLHNIEVLPAYQGHGLGTYLISALLAEAHHSGRPLVLQVLKVNPARHLYARLGFTITKETATHYVMHAWPKGVAALGGRGQHVPDLGGGKASGEVGPVGKGSPSPYAWPNKGLQLTASSVRCAPASGSS
jgi:ribosomal protein S18 acetylase RimI-like enzyme